MEHSGEFLGEAELESIEWRVHREFFNATFAALKEDLREAFVTKGTHHQLSGIEIDGVLRSSKEYQEFLTLVDKWRQDKHVQRNGECLSNKNGVGVQHGYLDDGSEIVVPEHLPVGPNPSGDRLSVRRQREVSGRRETIIRLIDAPGHGEAASSQAELVETFLDGFEMSRPDKDDADAWLALDDFLDGIVMSVGASFKSFIEPEASIVEVSVEYPVQGHSAEVRMRMAGEGLILWCRSVDGKPTLFTGGLQVDEVRHSLDSPQLAIEHIDSFDHVTQSSLEDGQVTYLGVGVYRMMPAEPKIIRLDDAEWVMVCSDGLKDMLKKDSGGRIRFETELGTLFESVTKEHPMADTAELLELFGEQLELARISAEWEVNDDITWYAHVVGVPIR